MKVEGRNVCKFETRYNTAITIQKRLQINSRNYDIRHIDDLDELHREMVLTIEEII